MNDQEQTLKEKYWKDGYIFQMSRRGKFRMVWGNKLIDAHGHIPASAMDDNLINTSTTDNNRVIAIYPPRKDAGWLEQLIEPEKDSKPLWSIAKNILTFDEVKQKLGLAEDEDLYIIKSTKTIQVMSHINNSWYTSTTDEWATPQAVFDALDAEFGFTLDPCASKDNHKVDFYFDKQSNGLEQNWGGANRVRESPFQPDETLGTQMSRREPQARHQGSDAHPCADRHIVLPRLHLSIRRSPLHPWSPSLQRLKARRTIPLNDSSI